MPTRIESANVSDSLFIKELGMPKVTAWECDNIFLTLMIRYGARSKELNIFHVRLVDRNFDIPTSELIEQ